MPEEHRNATPQPVKTGVPTTKEDSAPQIFTACFIVVLAIAIFVFLS